eukprot:SAG31_NODE_2131_length_6375_cov_5.937540_4_plen_99_part_00
MVGWLLGGGGATWLRSLGAAGWWARIAKGSRIGVARTVGARAPKDDGPEGHSAIARACASAIYIVIGVRSDRHMYMAHHVYSYRDIEADRIRVCTRYI